MVGEATTEVVSLSLSANFLAAPSVANDQSGVPSRSRSARTCPDIVPKTTMPSCTAGVERTRAPTPVSHFTRPCAGSSATTRPSPPPTNSVPPSRIGEDRW